MPTRFSRLFNSPAIPLCLCALIIQGCSVKSPMVSERLATKQNQTAVKGLVYYLPKSLVKVGRVEGQLEIFATINVPDSKNAFVLQSQFSGTNHDSPNFSVNAKGLLTTSSYNTDDKTPEIVDSTAQALTSVLTSSGLPSGSNFRTQAATGTSRKVSEFILDPFSPRVTTLGDMSVHFHFLDPSVLKRAKDGINGAALCPKDASICVPALTQVEVHLKDDESHRWGTVTVADPTRVVGIKLDRNQCVATQNQLVLNDGFIGSYMVTKPSEFAGCLSIPLTILTTILAAPINAITGRTQRLNAQKGLLQAQVDFLTKQNELLALQKPAPE